MIQYTAGIIVQLLVAVAGGAAAAAATLLQAANAEAAFPLLHAAVAVALAVISFTSGSVIQPEGFQGHR